MIRLEQAFESVVQFENTSYMGQYSETTRCHCLIADFTKHHSVWVDSALNPLCHHPCWKTYQGAPGRRQECCTLPWHLAGSLHGLYWCGLVAPLPCECYAKPTVHGRRSLHEVVKRDTLRGAPPSRSKLPDRKTRSCTGPSARNPPSWPQCFSVCVP